MHQKLEGILALESIQWWPRLLAGSSSRYSHSLLCILHFLVSCIIDWSKLTVCWTFSFAAMCWNLGTRGFLHGGGHGISICTCFLWWSWKPSEGIFFFFLKNYLCMVFGLLMKWCVINLFFFPCRFLFHFLTSLTFARRRRRCKVSATIRVLIIVLPHKLTMIQNMLVYPWKMLPNKFI